MVESTTEISLVSLDLVHRPPMESVLESAAVT